MMFRDGQEHRLWAVRLSIRFCVPLPGYVTWAGGFTGWSLSFLICQTRIITLASQGRWEHPVTWCRQDHCDYHAALLLSLFLTTLGRHSVKVLLARQTLERCSWSNAHNWRRVSNHFSWHEAVALTICTECIPKPGGRADTFEQCTQQYLLSL